MPLKQLIIGGWNGDASLSKAFWGYFIYGQFVVGFALIILASPLALISHSAINSAKPFTFAIYYAYLVWAMVSIWRCSKNTDAKFKRSIARLFVVIYCGLITLGIFEAVLSGT